MLVARLLLVLISMSISSLFVPIAFITLVVGQSLRLGVVSWWWLRGGAVLSSCDVYLRMG